jgi:hypothetical protein
MEAGWGGNKDMELRYRHFAMSGYKREQCELRKSYKHSNLVSAYGVALSTPLSIKKYIKHAS